MQTADVLMIEGGASLREGYAVGLSNPSLAERSLADARDELAHHLEIDVRFEQRDAHLAQRVIEILLGDFSRGSEAPEGLLETIGERVKHCVPV